MQHTVLVKGYATDVLHDVHNVEDSTIGNNQKTPEKVVSSDSTVVLTRYSGATQVKQVTLNFEFPVD